MNLPPVLFAASPALPAQRRARVIGIGDSNASRTLDGECAGEDELRRGAQPHRLAVQPSRNGTQATAPLWNGPRLKPAFVAQVLGQVMMDPQARALSLAPAAYRREGAQIAHGSFFDGDV